ncbi:MAG TPA: YbhB/YbcL family Raf kinase inhibitor-like protein [Candidatus Saccharimonadales bacterium]|nr:YbhB/YbcL family Raf kinase inhibitor-like protein [Candidatus Saccharimonadales bacterium]
MIADNETPATGLELISPVFRDGKPIPAQYSCKGQNVNPPLNIFNVPPSAQSLALIMHDPDAVSGDFLHWLLWDIPPSTDSIGISNLPVGARRGLNGSQEPNYLGPCPPKGSGIHRYIFELYALDTTLDLPDESNRADVTKAMQEHILADAKLTGTFAAE